MNICIVGTGSWGTALGVILAKNNHEVTLVARNERVVNEINTQFKNEKYLPTISLPKTLKASMDFEVSVSRAEVVVLAVPSQEIRVTARKCANLMQKDTSIVHVSKGLESTTHKRMSIVIEEEFHHREDISIAVLSGPSHAEEVVKGLPTTVTVASENQKAAILIQTIFANETFRVYTNKDVVGVEIGGALKNIIALGAGLSDGLGFGDNAKAALATRGIAEIARLGVAMGADPMTFVGLSGIGDLIVTCTSKHSRNWRAGYLLSQGNSLEKTLEEIGMVVEGIKTTKAVYELSEELGIRMPITKELYNMLYMGKEPKQAVLDLMTRESTHETFH